MPKNASESILARESTSAYFCVLERHAELRQGLIAWCSAAHEKVGHRVCEWYCVGAALWSNVNMQPEAREGTLRDGDFVGHDEGV